MILLAALATGLAVFVGARTLLAPSRAGRISDRLTRLAMEQPPTETGRFSDPLHRRVSRPLVDWFRARAQALLPSSLATTVEHNLRMAGSTMGVQAYWGWQIGMLLLGLGMIVLALSSGAGATAILALAFMGLLLPLFPVVWLRSRIGERQAAILKALPDAVDLIVTTVEAGLSVDAALAEVAEETEGPLGDELSLAMREIALGRSRRDALTRMIDRAPVPPLRSFIQALLQAYDTGIPVGQVLRTQAEELRSKRRQDAETTAGKAPVKLTLVLIFLVMPSMMLIMLGPAAIRFTQDLGN